MKATELRIGNWIKAQQFEGNITVFNNDKCVVKHKSGILKSLIKDLEPIPLTEEWLLKFGFERTDLIDNSNDDWTWLFYQKDSIYIDGSDLTIETATGIVIKVEYVHQLQNLYFALTGEELTL